MIFSNFRGWFLGGNFYCLKKKTDVRRYIGNFPYSNKAMKMENEQESKKTRMLTKFFFILENQNIGTFRSISLPHGK